MRAEIIKKEKDKRSLIQSLSAQGVSLLIFYEEGCVEKIHHEKIDDYKYLIHSPYEYSSLEEWLYLGNWQAVYPSNTDYKPFNTFKASDDEILNIMKEANIKLIIDSFYDDIEWNVINET